MTEDELKKELNRLVESGDQKALESFTLEHFKEFPEEMQGKILMGFVSEALAAEGAKAEIAYIQEEGLEMFEKLKPEE